MVIGITGSLGSGKTTVARMFSRQGARVIDADKIARQLLERSTKVYRQLVAAFGEKILCPRTRGIKRKRLARIVFAQKSELKQLNRIVHPAVLKIIKKNLRASAPDEVLVIDAPLLIEAGCLQLIDLVVGVKTNAKQRKQRLKKKGFTAADIKMRQSAQLPERIKLKIADFIIDNNSSIARTQKQVKRIWQVLYRIQSKK